MMLAWFFLCLRTGCDVRRVCQVSGLRAVNKKGCQDSGMSRANRIKRKCGIIRQDCREKNIKEKEFQEITQATAVTTRRPGVALIGYPFSL